MNITELLLAEKPPLIPAISFSFDPDRKRNLPDRRIATPATSWHLGKHWHSNHHTFLFYQPRFITRIGGKITDTRSHTGASVAAQFLKRKLGLKHQHKRWYKHNQEWVVGFFDPKSPGAIGAFTGRYVFLAADQSYYALAETLLIKPVRNDAIVWLLIEAPDLAKPIDIL